MLPNLGAMLAAATLFYCLFVFNGGERLFRDSDTGWHIRNGEWILAHGALPQTDPYSFSKGGQPWIAWEWGSDVLMGMAHRMDGLRGVTMLFALAISAVTWMCCRLHFAAGGDFLLTAVLAPPMITTASMHWLARPHVFSWLFLIGALSYAEAESRRVRVARFEWPRFAAIAAAAAVWTNLHASFFLAPAIALIYAVSHFARPLLWPADFETERARTRRFVWAGVAALAGSLLNPYGWRLHAHVLGYLFNQKLTSHVAEFQSFNFHDSGAMQVTLAVALAAGGGVLALTQRKLAHFLLAAILVWAGLRSARVLPLLALAVLPLANAAFTEALRGARNLRTRVQTAIDGALDYSGRLRSIDGRLNGAVFCAMAVLLAFLAVQSPAYSAGIGFSPVLFPVAAMPQVEALPADTRLLAPDSYGGYLIYRFDGARKVYFDGRSDFYGSDFMDRYLTLIAARPGWQQIAAGLGFTHSLLPNDSPLNAALQQAGWTVLYRDSTATLLGAK